MGAVVAEERAATDALVRRVQAGADREACGALYDRLAPAVQRGVVALRLGLSASEVEDVVQETFLRLFRAVERFEAGRSLEAYALGIARHVAADAARRRPRTGPDPDTRAGDGPAAGELAVDAERRSLVRAALDALEPAHRELLALRHEGRVSMQALADGLGCSLPTARARLREAARRFGAELRQRGVLPAPGEVSS